MCIVQYTSVLHTHARTHARTHTHTHTHTFNGPFSGTTRVSRYQKDKTNLDFTEARDNEWKWHQLGHMQVCISLQTDNHASTPPLKFFTGRMPFLPPNQQCQSTEGTVLPSEKIYMDLGFFQGPPPGSPLTIPVPLLCIVSFVFQVNAH